jgi:hypothetical protein
MTTKKLSDLDFMMMDVHRPMLDEEVNKINPQAVVDKSARPFQVIDGDAESVGTPYTGTRCDHCFGPMPCEKHANVEHLPIVTSLDVSPTHILAKAHDAGLTEVVIVGMREDGREYFASSISDAAPAVYHLQRGIYKLNKIVDGDYEGEDDEVGPKPAA